MSKLNKSMIAGAVIIYLSVPSTPLPVSACIYDMRPKNHFRGGSRGKGGKIKYKRG